MHKYFTESYFVTVAGLIIAYFWGEHVKPGAGFISVFIASILAILEVSLSFDNAVVNAMKLEKMSLVWQKRFLTWGIAIAVFGMRFLFPILVVAIFAHLDMVTVAKIAISDSQSYANYLHMAHAPIVTFGGLFLIMLFLNYFFDHEKDVHWIKIIERPVSYLDHIKGIEIFISLLIIVALQTVIPEPQKLSVVLAGIFGIVTYLGIDGVSHFLEKHQQLKMAKCGADALKCGGLATFLYLESK